MQLTDKIKRYILFLICLFAALTVLVVVTVLVITRGEKKPVAPADISQTSVPDEPKKIKSKKSLKSPKQPKRPEHVQSYIDQFDSVVRFIHFFASEKNNIETRLFDKFKLERMRNNKSHIYLFKNKTIVIKMEYMKEKNDEKDELLSSFDHPNLIKIHKITTKRYTELVNTKIVGLYVNYSLMDYTGNSSNANTTDFTEYLRILSTGVLRGLEYIHSKGAVHGNVVIHSVIKDKETWKLYGFSKLRKVPGGEMLVTKRSGKIYEVPPEYAISGIISTKMDIWQFGLLLIYRLLLQRGGKTSFLHIERLIEGYFGTQYNKTKTINSKLPLPIAIDKDVPDVLVDFLNKTLIVDHRMRWSATQLLNHRFITGKD
ncbi:FNKB [Enterospora canceri]|uniref:FNKB n=1 Tax=Enterospora canceri TaxID=1081671 RepID=A0A1Y1S583_9MICR|nr:FNKB [Enterospora canceri]